MPWASDDYGSMPEPLLQWFYHVGDRMACGGLRQRHDSSLRGQVYVQSGGDRDVAAAADQFLQTPKWAWTLSSPPV